MIKVISSGLPPVYSKLFSLECSENGLSYVWFKLFLKVKSKII